MAWVEGSVAPRLFLREFARILCTTNLRSVTHEVQGEELVTSDRLIFYAKNRNWDESAPPLVYENDAVVDSSQYTVDYAAGKITFNEARDASAVIKADYVYITEEVDPEKNWSLVYPDPQDYKRRISLSKAPMTGDETNTVYRAENAPWDRGYPVIVFVNGSEFPRYTQVEDSAVDEPLHTLDQVIYSSPHTNWIDTKPVTVRVNDAVISPTKQVLNQVTGEILTTSDNLVYQSSHGNWDVSSPVKVYENGTEITTGFTVNHDTGTVIFDSERAPSAVISVDYAYVSTETVYTVNYAAGYIEFAEPLDPDDRVTASYSYFYSTETYQINYDEGLVTFIEPRDTSDVVTASYTYIDLESDGFAEALGAIGRRVVLKTTTTPVGGESLTMYLEAEFPEYLVNVEIGLPYYEDAEGNTASTPPNYHGVRMRLVSEWDFVNKRPAQAAHVSPWSSLDWYRTFEDRLRDLLDDDPETDQLDDGVAHLPIELPETAADVPITYWGTVDNDRVVMIVLGAPGVTLEHYLSSFLYIGAIDPMKDGARDVEGNFVLTTTSSQPPARQLDVTIEPPKFEVIPPAMKYAPDGQNWDVIRSGLYYYRRLVGADGLDMLAGCHRYRVVIQREDGGFTLPSDSVEVKWLAGDDDVIYSDYPYTDGHRIGVSSPGVVWDPRAHAEGAVLRIQAPPGTAKIYVYRTRTQWTNLATDSTTADAADSVSATEPHRLVGTITLEPSNQPVTVEWMDPVSTPSPTGEEFTAPSLADIIPMNVRSVRRNQSFNAVEEIDWPDDWGQTTATGVLDLSMYKTFRGELFQRHDVAFISPGEGQISDPFQASVWTGMYHVSPIVVTHMVDGERGMLKDCLAVFDRSIVYGDTIYIDKDTPEEKEYRFFRITAPYHFLMNSPNPVMGIAIRVS